MDFLDAARVDEVAKAVRELKADGASRFVLDLRGNALGDTAEGIRMANLFLDGGTICSLKGQQREEETFAADKESTLTSAPVVVITDRATTGGAELVAAALLDNERGKITGERTYGLAAWQETIELGRRLGTRAVGSKVLPPERQGLSMTAASSPPIRSLPPNCGVTA